MNKELQTVVDWVDYYRGEFHLPVAERGGYAMLLVTDHIGIVHMPKQLAERVLHSLRERDTPGPLLARQIRWTMVASIDRLPGYEMLDRLARNDICVPVVGSALMIPTRFDRYTPEGAFWAIRPTRDQLLPLLSTVVSTALAETAQRAEAIGPE
ncbi:hypothetical protein [Nocardia terpenica]|uniref:Uncharacterized protein n=1 Tax=Nocardia terpenica TaxID=455432 RepID=A0A164NNT1_9NOCA|nr:hypothetical protein [Nocardia terpenica]KZM74560.1 hypothetical protein AWN90_25645 [Nocardia terpenica]NQE92934.1 hypothetical protein [Nocardia terpenica]